MEIILGVIIFSEFSCLFAAALIGAMSHPLLAIRDSSTYRFFLWSICLSVAASVELHLNHLGCYNKWAYFFLDVMPVHFCYILSFAALSNASLKVGVRYFVAAAMLLPFVTNFFLMFCPQEYGYYFSMCLSVFILQIGYDYHITQLAYGFFVVYCVVKQMKDGGK